MPYSRSKRWYERGVDTPHKALFLSVAELATQQQVRCERNRENVSQFLNKTRIGMKPGEIGVYPELPDAISLNLSHSATTTIAQKICMRKPRPYFLTDDGSYEEQERAKRLQKFVLGHFERADYYADHAVKAFYDAAICDIGCIGVYPVGGNIAIERVLPNELLVDEQAAYAAPPREISRIRYVPREVLAARFPAKRRSIMAANPADLGFGEKVYDIIEVIESYHLKSGPEANDGKRIVAIENDTLELSSWARDSFPYWFIRWDVRPIGFYGQGLVEQLSPIQKEINKVIAGCQEAMHLGAVAWVFYEKGTINKRHLQNKNCIFVEKTGGPDPKVVPNSPLSPQWIEYIDYLWKKGMALAGVSELSAHSTLPERLRGSGEALRTLMDTETQRFGLLARAWEEMAVGVAKLVIEAAKDLDAAGHDVSVEYSDKESVEKIQWKKCKVGDSYAIKVHPTSMLPDTPPGKIALANELISMGVVQNPTQALELVEYPDVEKFSTLETASLDAANMIAEYILGADDRYIAPEEFIDLELCKKVATKHWVRGYKNGVPESCLENLATWIKQCIAMQKEAEAQQIQEQMALQQSMQPVTAETPTDENDTPETVQPDLLPQPGPGA